MRRDAGGFYNLDASTGLLPMQGTGHTVAGWKNAQPGAVTLAESSYPFNRSLLCFFGRSVLNRSFEAVALLCLMLSGLFLSQHTYSSRSTLMMPGWCSCALSRRCFKEGIGCFGCKEAARLDFEHSDEF